MPKKTFYITTPIYYPSGKPHVGHAFSTISADVIARYKTLLGFDSFMVTGMDEHGQKIEEAAKKVNMKPKAYVGKMGEIFRDLWKQCDINFSHFVKTSDPKHEAVVQKVFQKFQDDKSIYLGSWEGLYCVNCEENYTRAQSHLNENGKLVCTHGHELIEKKEPSYFFKMGQFTQWVKQLYEDHPEFIIPQFRTHELIGSFLKDNLEDLSVSRTSLDWGIPVLSDPKHKVYVWIDALLNYLSALNYLSDDDQLFQKHWNNDDAEIVHLMSKEITRFHCIYWPIMLKCLNLRQPSRILSHGWIVTKEGKMSKSVGNVVDPLAYIQEFGSDALRYYLMKEISIEQDSVFARDLFIECYNADLANTYGNLVSRYIGMAQKYTNGVIQKGKAPLNELSEQLLNKTITTIKSVPDCINNLRVASLITNILELAKLANKYVEDSKPWILIKENKNDEVNNFLFCLGNAIRTISVLLEPILTKGTKDMITQLRLTKTQIDYNNLHVFELLNGHTIGASIPIYARITEKK